MFNGEKIRNDAWDYVMNDENYEITPVWEHYYMGCDYVNENYYKSLYADYEYYKNIMESL